MTLAQFNSADEMEQAEAIWSGVQLNQRDDGIYTILLYKIDDFYVEVYYHKQYNVIRKFEALYEYELMLYTDRSNWIIFQAARLEFRLKFEYPRCSLIHFCR